MKKIMLVVFALTCMTVYLQAQSYNGQYSFSGTYSSKSSKPMTDAEFKTLVRTIADETNATLGNRQVVSVEGDIPDMSPYHEISIYRNSGKSIPSEDFYDKFRSTDPSTEALSWIYSFWGKKKAPKYVGRLFDELATWVDIDLATPSNEVSACILHGMAIVWTPFFEKHEVEVSGTPFDIIGGKSGRTMLENLDENDAKYFHLASSQYFFQLYNLCSQFDPNENFNTTQSQMTNIEFTTKAKLAKLDSKIQ